MFQAFTSKSPPTEETDLTIFDDLNAQREGTATFDLNVSIDDIHVDLVPSVRVPDKASCSRIQFATKDVKFQENERTSSGGEIKPHSTPATLLWLGKNYELAEGICIPRNTLYSHYVHFCTSNSMSPLNSASFGKIIRQAFPSLTTRRLGTRGQSQYHYCGIAIKENSAYYEIAFSKMIFSCSDGKKAFDKNGPGTILKKNKGHSKIWPNFPNVKEIPIPPHIPEEKVSSFIIMYHTHCQRIFDTIVRGTIDDVYQFFEHFWQGVPSHLSDLLNTNTVVNMVGVCDSILYRTISSVLMPSVFKRCSENLIHMIRNFAEKLENWINSALTDVPENLKTVKLKLGKRFCTILRRQMLLYQLTNTAQVVLNNCEMMNHINKDWKRINLGPITRQALLFTDHSNDHIETINHINGYWMNFQGLIERQATIEDFTDIVETIVHRCVVEKSERKQIPLRKVARTFILLWHVIESLISRDMTIHSASSFELLEKYGGGFERISGSFHLIQTMFDEYMHYLVEMLHSEDVTKYLLKNVTLDVLPNFDSNWNEINEDTCVDLIEATSNLRSVTNVSGEILNVLPEDLPNNGYSFYTNPTEYETPKSNNVPTECSFIGNPCEYSDIRGELDSKYNNSSSYSEAVPLTGFSNCEADCIEFSAGIYCQEALQYNSGNIQYQDSNYSEEATFQCLQ